MTFLWIIILILGLLFVFGLVSTIKSQQSFQTPSINDTVRAELEQKRAGLTPLEQNALMRATIEPIGTAAIVVFVQLSDRAREVLTSQNLWQQSIFELPNPYYQQQLENYNRRWSNYHEAKNSSIEMARWTAREPTDPEPSSRIPVTIAAFCASEGYFRDFPTTGEAQNWTAELRNHIQKFKDIIEHQARPLKRETFDL